MNGALVLAYHSVHPERRGPLVVRPRAFEAQLRGLLDRGFAPVPLAACFAALDGAPLPERAVAVTFDDGYRDNLVHAVPALERTGFPATCFAVAGLVGTDGILEPDLSIGRYGGTPEDHAMLSWDELRELEARGVEIGSHTVTHRWLTDLAPDAVDREVRESKVVLERALGHPIESFCYPAGRHDRVSVEAVRRAGYRGAVVTPSGPGVTEGRFTLKRVGVYGHDTPRSFAFKTTSAFRRARESRLAWAAVKAANRLRGGLR